MIKQIAIIICIIIQPLYSFAGTQAECVMLARQFNDDFKGRVSIGINVAVPEATPELVVAYQKGFEPTLKEQARIAPVLRTCATTSLGRWVYQMRFNEKTAHTLCEQRNLDSMSAVCSKTNAKISFRKF